jgi:hypothetical protein
MSNPMIKRNPFESVWLSGANSAAGSTRGLWRAEMHRAQTTLLNETTEHALRFWTGGRMFPSARNTRNTKPNGRR